jgi:hypothetical protein
MFDPTIFRLESLGAVETLDTPFCDVNSLNMDESAGPVVKFFQADSTHGSSGC